MNPAQAMGVFLRTWRAEWAALSRTQLALAVSSLCPNQKAVTPEIVRAWESGQPPRTSGALDALLQVMRRRGLWERDVERFRDAAFAACAGRQYPELLTGESVVHREDIEQIAEATYDGCRPDAGGLPLAGTFEPRAHPEPPLDIVALVAWTKELELALHGDGFDKASRTQRRRLQAALAYLRAALGQHLEGYKEAMFEHAARIRGQNAEYLGACFGSGLLGGRISVLSERIGEAWSCAHDARSPAWARRLLELSEWARSRRHDDEAATAFLQGMHCLGELENGTYGAMRAAAREQLDIANAAAGGHHPAQRAYFHLVWAAMGDDLCDEAEHWLDELQEHSPDCLVGTSWNEVRTWAALVRGDRDAAQERHEVGRYDEDISPAHRADGAKLAELIGLRASARRGTRGPRVSYADVRLESRRRHARDTARRLLTLPNRGRPPQSGLKGGAG